VIGITQLPENFELVRDVAIGRRRPRDFEDRLAPTGLNRASIKIRDFAEG
jgi:hypothetical protein